MKKLLAVLAIALVSGCATYVDKQGQAVAHSKAIDCMAVASRVEGASSADAFRSNDALHPAAQKWREETDKCMGKQGYTRASAK